MEIRIFATHEEVARAAAQCVADAVRDRPHLVLGLPAGQTPVPVYAELRRLYQAGQVDLSRIICFTLDEFVGLERTHPGSFHRFMTDNLFSGVNVDDARVHSLNGAPSDVDAECDRYEAAITSAGGIDLQIVGLGTNGHIGFNEPGEALVSATHRVVLHAETRRDNAARFDGDLARVPREGLSMGIGTILKAKTILMIATGEAKANPVEQMVRGPVTTRVPASFLQLHRNAELFLDRAAAGRL